MYTRNESEHNSISEAPHHERTSRELPDDLRTLGREITKLAEARERGPKLEFPDAYPNEAEFVRRFVSAISQIWIDGVERIWNEKQRGYYHYLFETLASLKGGPKGLQEFISTRLAELIDTIVHGEIEDIDMYHACEYGDSALSLLARYGASVELIRLRMPELVRTIVIPPHISNEGGVTNDSGAVLFLCGYGARTNAYKGIFNFMNKPVIAYQLPYTGG